MSYNRLDKKDFSFSDGNKITFTSFKTRKKWTVIIHNKELLKACRVPNPKQKDLQELKQLCKMCFY